MLKDVTSEGFTFYTNLGSRKASELSENQKVSLHFPWHPLERQVIVYGTAERVSNTQVMKYFLSRPQREPISCLGLLSKAGPYSTRQALMQKFAEIKHKFEHGEVPLPSFWGGFLIRPQQIEFWQGGEHRLHDRFMYKKSESGWQIERLCP
ncbi:pyridoxal 5'-phosphate synthase [Alishewanella longhuensis]